MRTRATAMVSSGVLALPAMATPLLAEEAAGGGGIFAINPGLIVWTWVIFILLLVVLGKWAWGPIIGALEAREQRIQEALDAARRQREEAERLLAEHRRLLDEARGEAHEILAEGRKTAERIRSDMLVEARDEKDRIVEGARGEIQREREEAIDALRREAVDLSIAAASRVLQKNLDSDENRRLVLDYVDRVAGRDEGNGSR